MPKKTIAKETTVVRAARPKAAKSVSNVEVASTPRVAGSRVKSVKHSKVSTPAVAVNAHDQIAKIAYGYWEARGFQPGSSEQDWLRAEQEYLLRA